MANDTLRDNVRRDLQDSTRIPFSFKKFVQGIGEAVSNASRNAYDRITDVPDELRNGFSKVSSTIQSSTTEIMGSALNSMLNDIKSLASGVKDIAVGTFSKLFSFFGSDVEEDQLDQEKKQTKTLGNIFKIFKDWNKRDMFKPKEKKDKDDGFFTPLVVLGLALGAITGGIAAGIGGVIEYFLIPFKVVYAGIRSVLTFLKMSPIVEVFTNFFGKIRAFFGGWVDNALLAISNFFGKFRIFAGFFKGFGVGFMKLFSKIPVIGWFITGVMAVIDFFEGFFGKEGSFFEKMQAGITNMVTGFFDPIFEFVGWISDWVLSLFGIEGDTANTLKTAFKGFIDSFFNIFTVHLPNILSNVWNSLLEIKDWVLNYPVKEKFLETWEAIKEMADNLITSIKNWILSLIPSFDSLKEMLPSFSSIKEGITGTKDKAVEGAKSLWNDTKDWASGLFSKDVESPSNTVNELDSSNKARELARDVEMLKSLSRMEERAKQEARKREQESQKEKPVNQQVNVSSIQNSRGGSGSGTFIEAPDEIENFGMIFLNKTTLGGML